MVIRNTILLILSVLSAAPLLRGQQRICEGAGKPAWKCTGPVHVNSSVNAVGRINALYVDPSDKTFILAGTKGGGLWKTTDGGTTWKNITGSSRFPAMGVLSLAVIPGSSGRVLYASGCAGYVTHLGQAYSTGVFKSADGGSAWEATGLVFKPGDAEKVHRLAVNPRKPGMLAAISLARGSKTYITRNGGKSWKDCAYPDRENELGDVLIPSAGKQVYFSGKHLWRYNLATGSWKNITSALSAAPHKNPRMTLSSTGDELFVLFRAENGKYLIDRSTNGGRSWHSYSQTPLPAAYYVEASYEGFLVSPANPDIIYVRDANSILYKSTDRGRTFSELTAYNFNGTHCDIKAMTLFAASRDGQGDVLFIGTDGGVMQSENGGKTWKSLSGDMNAVQLMSVSSSETKPEIVVCAALDNDVYNNKGGSWNVRIQIGDASESLFNKKNAAQVIAQNPDNFYISSDSGISFSMMSKPQYKQGKPDRKAFKAPVVIENGYIYAAFHDIYAKPAGNPEKHPWQKLSNFRELQYARDSGRVRPITAMAVAPGHDSILYAAIHEPYYADPPVTYKFFRSADRGKTWNDLSNLFFDKEFRHHVLQWWNISDIAVNPQNPDELWVSISGFGEGIKAYHSVNGGRDWENISQGLPGFPANCIVYDPVSGILYTGTDTGVYYRARDMKQWECYGSGLPVIMVTELDINNTSRTIKAATLGRGVWEAGLR